MAASKRFGVVALAVGLVLLAGAPAGAQATWTQVPSPNRPGSNELQGTAGADAGHVWAVGRVVNLNISPATYRSLILRRDGGAWAPAEHPRLPATTPSAAWRAPGANDAWAVGTRQVTSGGLVTLSNTGTVGTGESWPAPTRTRTA